MSEPFVFDPRCSACKDPFGAVTCGSDVLFHCRPLATEAFSHCALVLSHEFAGVQQELELSLEGPAGERICFSGVLKAPSQPDLLWYHFRFWREDGTGCDLDRTGYRSDGQIDSWQLTVYAKNQTPEWFGGGIVYQIFPDRFCRLPADSMDVAGLVGNRYMHEHWSDLPEWRPDPDGEVRNRDFFGGTLRGVASKLPHLAELGVETIYLCPIFESASNHRYNTADYTKIDPLLGTEADFQALCTSAASFGIRSILDGVFNHTGSQSIYFNADGFYSSLGAAQSLESPYSDWYTFHNWPDDYDSWWGIRTLPAVREDSPSYLSYIVEGEDSIIRHWLRSGASGWRLDVADELPDWFIQRIRSVVQETKPDAFLLGEVWEDASNKIAYSQRRKYLLGSELHSVMNYPFRTALLAFLRGGDADCFREAMETLRENYPPDAFSSLLNFLGTHDTPRILTELGADRIPESKEARATYCLSPAERVRGEQLVRLASLILFTFPGAPMIYYGDEIGMEGFEDPFNRGTYPWDDPPSSLFPWFVRLGQLRRSYAPLRRGALRWLYTAGPILAYARDLDGIQMITAVNAGSSPFSLSLSSEANFLRDLLSGEQISVVDGCATLSLPPQTGLLLI